MTTRDLTTPTDLEPPHREHIKSDLGTDKATLTAHAPSQVVPADIPEHLTSQRNGADPLASSLTDSKWLCT